MQTPLGQLSPGSRPWSWDPTNDSHHPRAPQLACRDGKASTTPHTQNGTVSKSHSLSLLMLSPKGQGHRGSSALLSTFWACPGGHSFLPTRLIHPGLLSGLLSPGGVPAPAQPWGLVRHLAAVGSELQQQPRCCAAAVGHAERVLFPQRLTPPHGVSSEVGRSRAASMESVPGGQSSRRSSKAAPLFNFKGMSSVCPSPQAQAAQARWGPQFSSVPLPAGQGLLGEAMPHLHPEPLLPLQQDKTARGQGLRAPKPFPEAGTGLSRLGRGTGPDQVSG